ncbi:unnamed protein product [Ostreobium quekettii]|uniref:SH2 domain-containing protein n=1 Tax=Ostreobium quekettii TaxID=121088 RepID=A0A8S1IUN3_9CHLO|nr:unnamed protein product [Ostreobium quekettii]
MGGIGEEDWLAVGVDLAGRTEGRRGEAGEGEVSPRGGDVASLASDQEQVGVPPEDLPRQQLLFMTYGSSRQAKWVGEWCAKESQAANADRRAESGALTSPAAPSNLRAATMRVVQAPACLAQPVTQKKPFRIPFKVRLDLRYTERLQLPVKVEAIALPESSVEHLAKQQGEGALVPTQLTQQNELENATISCCIQTHDNDGVASCEKRCFEDLEFTDLRFSKSSRMSRRWILFACRLGWDMLYALYRLPTIVLSRRTDQFDKACVLLRQKNIVGSMVNSHQLQSPRAAGCPVLKDLEPGTPCIGIGDTIGTPTSDQLKVGSMAIYNSQGSIRQFIRAKYAESGLRRPLTDSDLAALDFKAGLRNTDSGFFADAHKWQEFQTWFVACLKSLKMVEHLWCPQGLMLICPFGIDREVAEYILQDRPLGTFVVRISSQPGALAISTKINVGGLSKVNHVLVDALDLKAQLLENWVLSNEWAKNLLDIHTGEYTSKWVAFAPQALTSGSSFVNLACMIAAGFKDCWWAYWKCFEYGRGMLE